MTISGKRARVSLISFLLLGYALFGKGFAHMGIHPFYVGEVVLMITLFISFFYGFFNKFNLPFIILIVIYVCMNTVIMLFGIEYYGVMAIRDSAIWYYSLFALIVMALNVNDKNILFKRVCIVLKYTVIIAPILLIIQKFYTDFIPFWPGSDIPIIYIKPGDVLVMLSGVLCLHLLKIQILNPILFILLMIEILVFGTLNRGGLLSLIVAVLFVFLLNPKNRRILYLLMSGTILISFLWISQIELNMPGSKRAVSFEQIQDNVLSISINSGVDILEGTKNFRLEWWNDIVNYTIYGDYFYFGKGYGVNLADDDGHQVLADSSLRSPHNIFMTILARTGVVGLTIWLFLILKWYASMFIEVGMAKKNKDSVKTAKIIFLIAFLSAYLVNGSFDVYLEGPVGGVWFWVIFGLGVLHLDYKKHSFN